MHGRVLSGAACLVLLACAPKDVYWTRDGGSEADFRRTSRACNEKAQIQAFEELGKADCGFSTGGGTSCRRADPNDPFEAEKLKSQREQRRKYLYGMCLESRGWVRNYNGQGFKGR